MRFFLKTLRLSGLVLLLGSAALIVTAILTTRPADPALWPVPHGAPTREVAIVSHGYHSGIVLRVADLSAAASQGGLPVLMQAMNRFAPFTWVEIGWGDAGFYRNAPTFGSIDVLDALRALFLPGNESVLHIVGLEAPANQTFPASEIFQTRISQAGFLALAARLNASFAVTLDGEVTALGPGIYGPSLFFEARGSFNLLHVCNHWVADLLGAAGLPVSPVLATYPAGLFLDLRWRAGLHQGR